MEIILLANIDNLGSFGNVVKVADGYARNYLFPKGLALKASAKNKKQAESRRRQIELQAGKEKLKIEEFASLLVKTPCTIKKQVGENERLFGSVTAMDIVKSLKEEGVELDKKTIILKEPLKALGIYNVPIKLSAEVTVELKVWVVKD